MTSNSARRKPVDDVVSDAAAPAHLRRVLAVWVALSIVGVILVVVGVPRLLPPNGSEAETFNNTSIVVFTALAAPVAMFVWTFLGYSLVRFRVKERPVSDGPRFEAPRRVQVGWLAVTSSLCLFLVGWGMFGLLTATPASAATLQVKVTGQQWSWTFEYPQYGVTSHELVLPAGRTVQFQVTSRDVLHGFSVTELGVRMDATPGEVVPASPITPSLPACGAGTAAACACGSSACSADYTARCVELCGTNHSDMVAAVHVVTADAFAAWLATQAASPSASP